MTSSQYVAEPAARIHPVNFSNPDAPVRVDVPMSRDLYDRLTSHDKAPRSRYDMATGLAEFVALQGLAHEWRRGRVAGLCGVVEMALEELGHPAARQMLSIGSTRLLSDDGAYEPDASLIVGRESLEAVAQHEGSLDSRAGHPLPALVAEIHRSVAAREKLGPYFRMGVREAWTWSRCDGARIWVSDAGAPGGCRAADHSVVLPGLDREQLDYQFAHPMASTGQLSREVAAAIAARGVYWNAG